MGYIYKITNILDGQTYVGATSRSLHRRFDEHCKDAKKFPERPLYAAINKYGRDSFRCEVIEECDDQEIESRESFWINELDTFKNGYNSTFGGAGKRMVDTESIVEMWNDGKTIKEIRSLTNYDGKSVRNALNHISAKDRKVRTDISMSKPVAMIDKDTNAVIKVFSGIEDANRYLSKQSGGHICQACTGKRKTAYGHKWKYVN